MSCGYFVFAHGSGIDDIAWFVGPALLLLWLLRVAERRARRRAAEPDGAPPGKAGERDGEEAERGHR